MPPRAPRPTQRGATQLTLAEPGDESELAAPWVGALVKLGTRLARSAGQPHGRKLVVAVTTPTRDFAAALIGAGWSLAAKPPSLDPPLETLRSISHGTGVCAVNDKYVVSGRFASLDEAHSPPLAIFAGKTWAVDRIRALCVVQSAQDARQSERPEPGSLAQLAGLTDSWDDRLVSPPKSLAIVGTRTWLEQDLAALIRKEGDNLPPSSLSSLVLPDTDIDATWGTRLYSAASFAEQLPLPDGIEGVLLDGNSAAQYWDEIDASVIICVIDRSVADETAAQSLERLRATRGEPVSATDELGWTPPLGVEVMAFTAAR